MLRSFGTAFVLFALWLSMSGIYKPLVVGLGVVSVILAVIVVRRMEAAAGDQRLHVKLRPFATIAYWAWLMVEIAKSNWAVTKMILSPEMKLKRNIFKVPCSKKTELGQAIFANSITLTPGTITVDVDEDSFLVHAVSYEDDTLDALGDMDARVSRIESADS